jgi:bifunctional DNA-binding transcriptional regulator/antitoxin component of YhaV-PrlF toxin-antitoxin module
LGVAAVVVDGRKPRSYRVTLIETVVNVLGLKKGDKIVFILDEASKKIEIRKA